MTFSLQVADKQASGAHVRLDVTSVSSLRIVHWMERVTLCLALLFLSLHSLPRAWRTLNTDFPNYYMAARLVHDGFDTSRMYEWSWIEREKDHRAVDIRVIGLLPITPFSTLAVWPLAGLEPLAAKRVWILLNLGSLFPIVWMLRSMTGLSYRRIALVTFLSFPLYRNLLYGQFYIFLLLLLTGACFSYLRGHRSLSGALVAIAAACKVFPLLIFIFFLQRRDWRALLWGAITGFAAIAVSVAVFGVNANRTWLNEILPWVMHGEGLGTYSITASISGVLHRLLLSEPQWNPHPWHDSPLLYAWLVPILQMLTLAPAILLLRRREDSERRILLEWSALITVALGVSTIPASYNFVLMIFPVCVLSTVLLRDRSHGWLAALIVAYLGIGFPLPVPNNPAGLALLLYVPRLPLMFAVLLGIYALLWRDRAGAGGITREAFRDRTRVLWAAAMAVFVILSVRSTLHLERGEREEYPFRLPLNAQGFLNASPQLTGDSVHYIAFTLAGYHLVADKPNESTPNPDAGEDDLSFTSGRGETLIESASRHGSRIIDVQHPSQVLVEDAREPMLSIDGKDLAFLRDDHGRGQLMLRQSFRSNADERALTPPRWNVYEASFLSPREYAVAAVVGHAEPPEILVIDTAHSNTLVSIKDARYPALSPDGRWLAYSHLDRGVWNLWIRQESSGAARRIANVPCNQIQPSWESDARTLLYSTDCGRSLWFTAVARRKVLP